VGRWEVSGEEDRGNVARTSTEPSSRGKMKMVDDFVEPTSENRRGFPSERRASSETTCAFGDGERAGRGSALARTDGLFRGVPREDLVREALELVAHLIAAELALEVHGDVPLERDRDARAVDVRDAVRARAEKHLLDAVLEPARAGEDGGRDTRGKGRGS
jgi:hypothetical protein